VQKTISPKAGSARLVSGVRVGVASNGFTAGKDSDGKPHASEKIASTTIVLKILAFISTSLFYDQHYSKSEYLTQKANTLLRAAFKIIIEQNGYEGSRFRGLEAYSLGDSSDASGSLSPRREARFGLAQLAA
jgi:hypothetical protein